MPENIINQVKQAEKRIHELDRFQQLEKEQLQQQMDKNLEAYQQQLKDEQESYKEKLKLENQNALEKQKQTMENERQLYQAEILKQYQQNKNIWIRQGIEEVMRAYGHRPNETVDNR